MSEELVSVQRVGAGARAKAKPPPVMEYGTTYAAIDQEEHARARAKGAQAKPSKSEGGSAAVPSSPQKKQGQQQQMALAQQYLQQSQQSCEHELEQNPARCAEKEYQTKCDGFDSVSALESRCWMCR